MQPLPPPPSPLLPVSTLIDNARVLETWYLMLPVVCVMECCGFGVDEGCRVQGDSECLISASPPPTFAVPLPEHSPCFARPESAARGAMEALMRLPSVAPSVVCMCARVCVFLVCTCMCVACVCMCVCVCVRALVCVRVWVWVLDGGGGQDAGCRWGAVDLLMPPSLSVSSAFFTSAVWLWAGRAAASTWPILVRRGGSRAHLCPACSRRNDNIKRLPFILTFFTAFAAGRG